jgi:hypothetical protein
MKIIFLAICVLGLSACATGFKRVGYALPVPATPSDKPAKVAVAPTCKVAIKYQMSVPKNAKKIGEVEAYDPMWMAVHCCEDLALSTFVKDACAMNANVINIVDETPGSIWHCYTAKAELLSVANKDVKSDEKYAAEKIKERSEKMDKQVHALLVGAAVGGAVAGAAVVSGH